MLHQAYYSAKTVGSSRASRRNFFIEEYAAGLVVFTVCDLETPSSATF